MPFTRSFNALDHHQRAGLVRLEQLLGAQTFTWKGVEVVCVPSEERRGLVLTDDGGFARTVQLSLYVRRENFPTADTMLITADAGDWTVDTDQPNPTAGRKLTFRGRDYRIITVAESPTRSHFVIDLDSPES